MKNKNKILLVTLSMVFSISSFLISCSKDDDEKSCYCTETDYEGYSASQTVNPASFGAANCSDLVVKLRMASNGEFDYSCK